MDFIEQKADEIMQDKNPLISFGYMEQVHAVLARKYNQEVRDITPAHSERGFFEWRWFGPKATVTARYTIRYRVNHGIGRGITQNTWTRGQVVPLMEDILAPA